MRGSGDAVTGLFYNPNIHQYSEYIRRREAAQRYAAGAGLELIEGPYDMENYFQNTAYNEKTSSRCPVCWWLRISKTAKSASEKGFDAFTTTLLGSPYQDHDVIKNICEDVSGKSGVNFYYRDFRAGFRQAQAKAKASGIYCQNYCGCVFSEKERLVKKHGPWMSNSE